MLVIYLLQPEAFSLVNTYKLKECSEEGLIIAGRAL